jgi:CBS domain-containing protein
MSTGPTPPRAPRVAADLMDRRPAAVSPETRIGEVARLIVERGVSGVPVVAPSGEVIGLITEVDLVTRHAHVHFPTYLSLFGMAIRLSTRRAQHELDEETRRIVARTAAEIMDEDFGEHTVEEDTPVEDVAARLAKTGSDPLVVLRGDRLAGLITRTTLVRLVAVEEAAEGAAEGAGEELPSP